MYNNPYINKSNSELVAVCFFSKETGKAELRNYDRFYQKKEERIQDILEMNADY